MIKVQEAKQVGVLYHYTSLKSMIEILDSDKLVPFGFGHSDEPLLSNSFTRDPNFHKVHRVLPTPLAARFVVDGDKLSDRYRLTPYNYYDRRPDVAPFKEPFLFKNSESEEMVQGKAIRDFSKYIIRIDLLSGAFEKSSARWLQHIHLQCLEPFKNLTKDEMSPEYMKDYVEKTYGIPVKILKTVHVESFDVDFNDTTLFGWWVGKGKYAGDIYELDRKKDIEHLTWAYETKSWDKLGLTDKEAFVLARYARPHIYGWNREDSDLYDLAQSKLDKYWIRTTLVRSRISGIGPAVYFDIKDKRSDTHSAIINFLLRMPSFLQRNLSVNVSGPTGNLWWSVPFEDAINSKSLTKRQ